MNTLEHAVKRKYDPVKRREYYLRTRELKGRNPSKAQESFRSGERNLGKNAVSKAEKERRKRADDMLDVVLDMKSKLDKLEEQGKTNTTQYKTIRQYYVKALNTLSRIDPDANWYDSKRQPEYNKEKLKELLKKSPL